MQSPCFFTRVIALQFYSDCKSVGCPMGLERYFGDCIAIFCAFTVGRIRDAITSITKILVIASRLPRVCVVGWACGMQCSSEIGWECTLWLYVFCWLRVFCLHWHLISSYVFQVALFHLTRTLSCPSIFIVPIFKMYPNTRNLLSAMKYTETQLLSHATSDGHF